MTSLIRLITAIKSSIKHSQKCFIIKQNKKIILILKFFLKLNLIYNYYKILNFIIVFIKIKHIRNIKLMSYPGKKKYYNIFNLKAILNRKPRSLFLVSTNKGILLGKESLKNKRGGLILLKVDF